MKNEKLYPKLAVKGSTNSGAYYKLAVVHLMSQICLMLFKIIKLLFCFIVIIVMIFVMLLLFFSLWKGLGLPVPMYQATTRTNKQLFQIADEKFLIPKNYIWQQDNRLKVDGVLMHTLYPSMSPYTEQTKALFDEPGWKNGKLNFSIYYATNPQIVEKQMAIIQQDWKRGMFKKMSTRLEGFEVYHPENGKGLIFDKLIGKLDNGVDFVFKCTLLDRKLPFKTYPYCKTTILLTPKIIITYAFQRNLLPQWRKINQKVVELVESFRKNGTRYATQNKDTGEH